MSPVIYFSATCYLLLLQCTIVFLCKGISDPALTEAEKHREKSLQRGTRLGQKCFKSLKGVVSANGDEERSSGVDDPRREPPTQVLALTSQCHMWLHVPYGV